MKKMISIVITIIAMMFVQDAFAQAKPQTDADKAKKEQLMQTRLGMLKDELKLTDAQAVKFEPIYREYRKEMSRVVDNKTARTKKEEMTNDNALKVIATRLSNTINTSSLKQRYIYIFAEVLEPLQIEKLYRIDDRIAKEARKVVQYRK
ncbi:MAG: Spy/CpxP family protein refolding chaperone [Alistipes sp.]|nr:Spy/CpxP family protein refolding chaperone [Alistipes sp.]MBS6459901.1 Spy/CpxP family protein refolding chaperone [Alistipes sp.]